VHNTCGPDIYQHPITPEQALKGAERWLGDGYTELGNPGSGVFRSSDGLRPFRMTNGDLAGTNGPPGLGPHVHFETLQNGGVTWNTHYPLVP
jgi:hypothetical protein